MAGATGAITLALPAARCASASAWALAAAVGLLLVPLAAPPRPPASPRPAPRPSASPRPVPPFPLPRRLLPGVPPPGERGMIL